MNARDAVRRAALRGVRLGRRAAPRRPSAAVAVAPSVPAGWHTAPPDFVGVGATGTSTAWWHAQIERHPDVKRLSGVPGELHWFDRFWGEPFAAADAARYAEWFPRPEGGAAGEWTPTYLADFWVPEMLAVAAPDARILVLLRDPVERYAAARARAALPGAHRWDDRDALGTFQRGLYAEPLRRLLSAFPPDHVLVLQEEACRAGTEAELARTLAFVGLSAAELAPAIAPPVAASGVGALADSVRRALVDAYAPDLAELAALVPDLDLGLWPAASGASA